MSHDVRAQPASASQAPDRDPAVDAARVACVITVVCLHILMVTITRDPASGEIRSVLVPTLQPWYWWATWLLQLSLIHISEPTRRLRGSRMPSSA